MLAAEVNIDINTASFRRGKASANLLIDRGPFVKAHLSLSSYFFIVIDAYRLRIGREKLTGQRPKPRREPTISDAQVLHSLHTPYARYR